MSSIAHSYQFIYAYNLKTYKSEALVKSLSETWLKVKERFIKTPKQETLKKQGRYNH